MTDEQIIEAMCDAYWKSPASAKDDEWMVDVLAAAKPLIREQALMNAVSVLKMASDRGEDRLIASVYNLSAALVLALIPEPPHA